jgi:DNA-binding MarR family transcriptional regulator
MLNESFRFFRVTREAREAAVLAEVEKSPLVSQRAIARAAGVSATMVNAYIDDLVARGLCYVTGETNRSYRYFLTADGAARRRELLEAFVREATELYRRVVAQHGGESRAKLEPESGAEAA